MKWYTAFGVAGVIVLFAAAMWFPEYYSRLYDDQTLDQAEFTDINMSTYETSYDCFMGKLYAIAKVWNENAMLSAVRTDELELTMDKSQFAKIVRKEMKELFKLGLLQEQYKPRAKNLTRCERYTIYASGDASGMKGISCWKLVFERVKKSMTVYLDEEYHKIYYVEYWQKAEGEKGDPIVQDAYGKSSGSMRSYSVDEAELGYGGWEGGSVNDYYDAAVFQDVPYASWVHSGSVWVMEFDGKYPINLIKQELFGESGSVYRFGLPMEKMIQF
jgi:hypothetical protein